jgi:hypothetical protein
LVFQTFAKDKLVENSSRSNTKKVIPIEEKNVLSVCKLNYDERTNPIALGHANGEISIYKDQHNLLTPSFVMGIHCGAVT